MEIKDLANNLYDSAMLLKLAALEDEHKLAMLSFISVQDYLLGVHDCQKRGKENPDFLRNRHYQTGFGNQYALEQIQNGLNKEIV
jgi:hypothetical protein